jgi:hypothetical protein
LPVKSFVCPWLALVIGQHNGKLANCQLARPPRSRKYGL